jgi:hypothetical protein
MSRHSCFEQSRPDARRMHTEPVNSASSPFNLQRNPTLNNAVTTAAVADDDDDDPLAYLKYRPKIPKVREVPDFPRYYGTPDPVKFLEEERRAAKRARGEPDTPPPTPPPEISRWSLTTAGPEETLGTDDPPLSSRLAAPFAALQGLVRPNRAAVDEGQTSSVRPFYSLPISAQPVSEL